MRKVDAMSITDQFLLAVQAYREIQTELHPKAAASPSKENAPDADGSDNSPQILPDGSLLLGLAEDGLPLMLDLYDPAPGPLLVAGDRRSGKTAFLKSLARASDLRDPGEIQFGVVTPFPEEWEDEEALSNCLGIWPAYHPSSQDFLSQVVSWADALARSRQVILVMVDGFDLLNAGDTKLQHDLRWLFLYGPERQAWPVVTVNPGRLNHLDTWLDYFQTRILGRVSRYQTARLLLDKSHADLSTLEPGIQYGLSRPEGWMKFWLPPQEHGDNHEHWNALVRQ
jgi:hypothetical protein